MAANGSVGQMIEVFTDGGCSGNPGPGGWAYHLTIDRRNGSAVEERENSGAVDHTTNNRMEMTAVIEALMEIQESWDYGSIRVVVSTDSTYVQQGISSWIHRWRRNHWKTANGKPVKNADLWGCLDTLSTSIKAEFRWVRGHTGDQRNERCHQLVQEAIGR